MSIKKPKIRNAIPICCFMNIVTIANNAFAITWDVQAERLQMVSASFLDANPLLSSTGNSDGEFRLEGKAIVTVLPKMNATVGSKSEQPPQPPAHSIPTMELDYVKSNNFFGAAIFRLWQGYLPGDAGKSTGMNASCAQSITGYSLGIKNNSLPPVHLTFEIGQQRNETKVEGGITEATARDLFIVKTRLRFATLTMSPEILPKSWIQAQITERKVSTHFEIPSDGTTFDLTDSSSVAARNAATQFSAGYEVGQGFQVAAAYLNVPQRSTTPRFLLSYSKVFSGSNHLYAGNNH